MLDKRKPSEMKHFQAEIMANQHKAFVKWDVLVHNGE